MPLITLLSASGSPGVTTTGVGLALTWPRPVVLVEADPSGGSPVLAGYFRGTVAHPRGLIDLAWAHREGRVAEVLPGLLMPMPGSQASLLPGVRAHTQARTVAAVWEPLLTPLRERSQSGSDVIVDAGRLGVECSPLPLIFGADLTLLVVRSDLVALSVARSWSEDLRTGFGETVGEGRLALLLVGEGRPYRAREVAKVLGLPVLGSLAWDPAGAAVFAHGAPPRRRFDASALPTSLRAVREAIQAAAQAAPGRLEAEVVGGEHAV